MQLIDIYRPSAALTKLIEATGLLIGAQSKNHRSKYKTSLPSNYNDTVQLLNQNLTDVVNYLSNLKDAEISNEMANKIYSKTLEEGFDYERACDDGGMELKELFHAVQQIIVMIEVRSSAACSIPMRGSDLIVAITNDKASYAVFDAAAHILGYGSCTLLVYVDEAIHGVKSEQSLKYLSRDIDRRCFNQYKIPKTNYTIGAFVAQGGDQVLSNIEESIGSTGGDVFCLGLNDNNIGLDGSSHILMWAAWVCTTDVIMTPGHAQLSPPNFTQVNWTTLIYFKLHGQECLRDVYQNALKFIRPGDFVVFVVSADKRTSLGDNRDTRFEFGSRLEWTTEDPLKSRPFYANDADLEELITETRNLLINSQVEGILRVEYDASSTTTAQLLCRVSIEERADAMIIKRNQDTKNMIIECAQESPCSIIIIK